MSLGGVSSLGPGANHNQSGQGANAGGESSGKEFALEKQATGESSKTQLNHTKSKSVRGKSTQIVDRKKKNRKGAPRTILVDGDLYEVFLLAIA